MRYDYELPPYRAGKLPETGEIYALNAQKCPTVHSYTAPRCNLQLLSRIEQKDGVIIEEWMIFG